MDSHAKIEENHTRLCRSVDKPIAGLLSDLKARGLLDETLVIWGGEFGPHADERAGRRTRSQPERVHDVDGGGACGRADDRLD